MAVIATWTNEEMQQAEAEQESRKLIPEGTYDARIVKVEERAAQSGTFYISIELVVDSLNQRRAWDAIFINSPKPAGRSIALHQIHEYLRACGLPDNGQFDTNKLELKEIRVRVEIDDSGADGKKRNRFYPLPLEEKPKAQPTPAPTGPDSFASDSFDDVF